MGSVVSIVILVIASLVFDAGRLPGWLLDDPARLAPVVWIAAVAVIAKYWIAAYAWRRVAPRYLRVYLLIWLAATASFLALGIVLWGILRIYLPLDVDRIAQPRHPPGLARRASRACRARSVSGSRGIGTAEHAQPLASLVPDGTSVSSLTATSATHPEARETFPGRCGSLRVCRGPESTPQASRRPCRDATTMPST